MVFRSCTIPAITGLEAYIDSIAASFCPYIDPSTKARAMRTSIYHIAGGYDQAEASIFYLGLIHTEILRRVRRAVASPRLAVLACENVIFRFDDELIVDGKALFAWPHWLLKCEYTSSGVLFGKFWLGGELQSRSDQAIPPPPYHLLSVRSAIVKRDPQFFSKAPELLGDLLGAADEGTGMFGFDALPIASEAFEWPHSSVLAAYQQLLTTGMYERIKAETRARRAASTDSN